VGADITDFSRKMSAVGRQAKNIGSSMAGVGKSLTTRVTLPLAGLGALIVKTGAQFDDQMSSVKAGTGSTGTEMEKLREQAKKLGRDTRFSATEAAEGMEMLARAGFETDEIMNALPDVLNLAAA